MENYQKASVEKGNISDSNNRNKTGRDVIFKYGDESYIDKELQASQDNIIAAQATVIERLQHQINRMQDQMEVYQTQFTKAQELKERLMDMLLEDRKLLQKKLEEVE